jgi:murE/murF fusion protein
MLCAAGIGITAGENLKCIQQGIESITNIPGRLEKIPAVNSSSPTVFVDYAHTPDALENVLNALRKLNPRGIIGIFGCGGDRDPGKRPLMGEIAGRLSDIALATSDNPRSESPETILGQIEEGLSQGSLLKARAWEMLSQADGCGYDIITSRSLAIETAIRFANPEDVIVISGKGHENYQISSEGRIFFDDRIEAEIQLHAAAGLEHIWRTDWLQQITGAQLFQPIAKHVTCTGISTDTRTIKHGDLFVALKGDNFDGNAFAEKAVSAGAAALLLNLIPGRDEQDLGFEPKIPVLLVPDTLVALGKLAASRRRWNNNLQVLALTGSSGKTTVKEMLGSILSRQHAVLKTEGNFNNLVGLPLTLLNLKDEHEVAILEMGMNHPGEIGRLTEIADPDIACIINVQEAHLEGLGDINGVARAKNELFVGLKPEGRVAVNLDDEIVHSLAGSLFQEKITFGCSPDAFVRATDIKSLGREGMSYTLHIGDDSREITIKGIGRHNVSNSLAAAAMASLTGVEIDEICAGLSAFLPYDKRACTEELKSGIQVLNDSYNANPASMMAALETLKDLKRDRRAIAVLGDMLELGAKSDAAHKDIGKAVSELSIDFLAAYGSLAEHMVAGALAGGMDQNVARHFMSKNEIVVWLNQLMEENKIEADDWILIKGSRGMRMEEVLEILRGNQNNILAGGN